MEMRAEKKIYVYEGALPLVQLTPSYDPPEEIPKENTEVAAESTERDELWVPFIADKQKMNKNRLMVIREDFLGEKGESVPAEDLTEYCMTQFYLNGVSISRAEQLFFGDGSGRTLITVLRYLQYRVTGKLKRSYHDSDKNLVERLLIWARLDSAQKKELTQMGLKEFRHKVGMPEPLFRR